MTKEEREIREYDSLFTDERYAKRAWKKFIGQSLQSDAALMPEFMDAKGNVAPQSIVYNEAYKNVKRRLEAHGISRPPMKAEVLVEANVIKAAFDNSTFNTILDRTAGKVKEEINVSTNQYQEMTDEELELLVAFREQKALEAPEGGE